MGSKGTSGGARKETRDSQLESGGKKAETSAGWLLQSRGGGPMQIAEDNDIRALTAGEGAPGRKPWCAGEGTKVRASGHTGALQREAACAVSRGAIPQRLFANDVAGRPTTNVVLESVA